MNTKKVVLGVLAHVDAGKTTLAESMLYLTGSIRKLGRVDHKDAFLDTYQLERARGITIFSKQAVFSYKEMEVTLLDTPGHVDFSAEMERTLQVLDYAILVISASDGIQGHTETLWRLLARYQIPTFLFVNKMDLDRADRTTLMTELKKQLSDGCLDFTIDQNSEEFLESVAMCDEALLEQYIETGRVSSENISVLIRDRKVFPCFFGSALKLDGVEQLLDGMEHYTRQPQYGKQFGAKVFKIARDDQGTRLTYMKITGGSLKVKALLSNRKDADLTEDNSLSNGGNLKKDSGQQQVGAGSKQQVDLLASVKSGNQQLVRDTAIWEEKVDQIRIYSGVKYEAVDEVGAGTICAVTGPKSTYPGEGLGSSFGSDLPLLEPVLNYQILLPQDCDAHSMLTKLRTLEEEDPQLHIVWSEQLKEIHVMLMGEVQVEILKSLILERFGVNVEFGTGNIVYKETIQEASMGIGHFEPLRHYAEVHLLLEPQEPGSGLTFHTVCSEDDLDRSWQRLILTHLEEKEHVGVLTGSPITDIKVTLIAGRAHLKHTEGGDFRQATYRAVRHGLKKAKSVLLEPYYHFKLELPQDQLGRAMSDLQRMSGSFQPPTMEGDLSILTGQAPVATMRGYHTEVTAYTRGRGRLFVTLGGYLPCHNAEEVIDMIGYDSERDLENPTGSVFCAHGAGFVVPWEQVEQYKHIESSWQPEGKGTDQAFMMEPPRVEHTMSVSTMSKPPAYRETSLQEDKELEAIFVRTFGPIKQKLSYSQGGMGYEKKPVDQGGTQKQATDGKQGQEGNKVSEDKKAESYMNSDKKAQYNKSRNGGSAELKKKPLVKEYLLVDGYNIIFSWEELSHLAKENMDAARNKLMDILCNYQGFKKCILILVFDAYKVKGGLGTVQDYHNIHVVYTKEAETADQYIEKVTHEIAKEHHVTVATSDALQQMIILGQGAVRLSANDLKEEIKRVREIIRRDYLEGQSSGRAYLGERFEDTFLDFLEEE